MADQQTGTSIFAKRFGKLCRPALRKLSTSESSETKKQTPFQNPHGVQVDTRQKENQPGCFVFFLTGALHALRGTHLIFRYNGRCYYYQKNAARPNVASDRRLLLQELIQAGCPDQCEIRNATKSDKPCICVTSDSLPVLSLLFERLSVAGLSSVDVHTFDKDPSVCSSLQPDRSDCIELIKAAEHFYALLARSQQTVSKRGTGLRNIDLPRDGELVDSILPWLRNRKAQLKKRIEESRSIKIPFKTKSVGEDEVHDMLLSDLDSMTSSASLDGSTALTLLSKHQYDRAAALKEAEGLKTLHTSPSQQSDETSTCCVCFNGNLPGSDTSIDLPCTHVTCNACWKGILDRTLKNGDVNKAVCPVDGCNFRFPLNQISLLLEEQAAQFMRLLYLRYIDSCCSMKWCPRADCGRAIKIESTDEMFAKADVPQTVKCDCGYKFCWNCMKDSHEPATCEQAANFRDGLDAVLAENRSLEWLSRATVSCPHCNSPIERDGGCNHMTCTNCQQEFCYQCGQKWKGHNDHYTCSATNESFGERKTRMFDRFWSALETLSSGSSRVFGKATYEWHLRRYLKHNMDEKKMRGTAESLDKILGETLPHRNRAESSPFEEVAAEYDTSYLMRWLDVLLRAEEILQNSYILSFNLRNRSTNKEVLEDYQRELEMCVEVLKHCFSAPHSAPQSNPMSASHSTTIRSRQRGSSLLDPYLFAYVLHNHKQEVEVVCDNAERRMEDIKRGVYLNLFLP